MSGSARFELALIGGTFSALHEGHKAYILQAFSLANRVLIGLTANGYVQPYKSYRVPPLAERQKTIENYLAGEGVGHRIDGFLIYRDQSDFPQALLRPELDCVVTPEEYRQKVELVNVQRRALRLPGYHIHAHRRFVLHGHDLSSAELLKAGMTTQT